MASKEYDKIKHVSKGIYLTAFTPLPYAFPEQNGIQDKLSPGKIFQQESYHLCRCGNSEEKPFCDGTHLKNMRH